MILVIDHAGEYVGILVDHVDTVTTIAPETITAPTGLLTNIENRYIAGIVSTPERFIILLDPTTLFTPQQQAALDTARTPESHEDHQETMET